MTQPRKPWSSTLDGSGDPTLEAIKTRCAEAHVRLFADEPSALDAIRSAIEELEAYRPREEGAKVQHAILRAQGHSIVANRLLKTDPSAALANATTAGRIIDSLESAPLHELDDLVSRVRCGALRGSAAASIELGNLPAAEVELERATAIAEEGIRRNPGEQRWLVSRALVARYTTQLARVRGQQTELEDAIRSETDHWRRAATGDLDPSHLRRLLGLVDEQLRNFVTTSEELIEDPSLFEETARIIERLDASGDATGHILRVASRRLSLVSLSFRAGGDFDDAVEWATRANNFARRALELESPETLGEQKHTQLIRTWSTLVDAIEDTRDPIRTMQAARDAIGQVKSIQQSHPTRGITLVLAKLHAVACAAECNCGHPIEASRSARRALELSDSVVPPTEPGSDLDYFWPRFKASSTGACAYFTCWRPVSAARSVRRAQLTMEQRLGYLRRRGDDAQLNRTQRLLVQHSGYWRRGATGLLPWRYPGLLTASVAMRDDGWGLLVRTIRNRRFAKKFPELVGF